jgi:hypothetical protein
MKPATQGGVREVLVAFMNDTSHQLYVNKALGNGSFERREQHCPYIVFCTVEVSTRVVLNFRFPDMSNRGHSSVFNTGRKDFADGNVALVFYLSYLL